MVSTPKRGSGSCTRAALVGLVVAVLVAAGAARAEALVVVQLRNAAGAPADGKVILETDAGQHVADCTTHAGTCEMSGVPGGSYKARIEPRTGKAPKPRSVMIPPTGKVSLIVSTGG
jgi:hypothetical protein